MTRNTTTKVTRYDYFHLRRGGKKMKPTVRIVFLWTSVGVAIIWSVIGLILITQFRDLKSQLAELERRMSATIGEVVDLQNRVRESDSSQPNVTPSRSEGQNTTLVLSASDIQIIRQFIKVAPTQSTAQAKLKVGDGFPEATSLPIPKEVSDKLPKLRDARFAIGQNGTIIIGTAGEKRVAVIIDMSSAPKTN